MRVWEEETGFVDGGDLAEKGQTGGENGGGGEDEEGLESDKGEKT